MSTPRYRSISGSCSADLSALLRQGSPERSRRDHQPFDVKDKRLRFGGSNGITGVCLAQNANVSVFGSRSKVLFTSLPETASIVAQPLTLRESGGIETPTPVCMPTFHVTVAARGAVREAAIDNRRPIGSGIMVRPIAVATAGVGNAALSTGTFS